MEYKQPAWWRGTRCGWHVATQVVLIAVVFFGPRALPSFPVWPTPFAIMSLYVGLILMVAGGCLLLAGSFRLGANLTPLPYPKERSALVQSGPYGLVRHPMYAGGILLAYGWTLAVRGWFTLVYSTVLLIFLEVKAKREELWLIEKYPECTEYQLRVRTLIPFIH